MKLKIIEITNTCAAYPSQWEFKTEDNRIGYVRYRFSKLVIHLSDPGENLKNAMNNRPIFEAYFGIDPNCGELSDENMLHCLCLLDFEITEGLIITRRS